MWVDEEVKEENREKRLNKLKKKTIKSLKWKGNLLFHEADNSLLEICMENIKIKVYCNYSNTVRTISRIITFLLNPEAKM